MSFAPSFLQSDYIVPRKDGAKHLVDNFGSTDDSVVVGFDRWRRWQLDTSAAGRSAGRFDPANDYRSSSGDLGTAGCFDGARYEITKE